MARGGGKKKGGGGGGRSKRGDEDSDSDDAVNPHPSSKGKAADGKAPATTNAQPQTSRSQKRAAKKEQKQQQQQQHHHHFGGGFHKDDGSSSGEDDDDAEALAALIGGGGGGRKKNKNVMAAYGDSDSDDDQAPTVTSHKAKNQAAAARNKKRQPQKKLAAAAALLMDTFSSDEEEEEEEEKVQPNINKKQLKEGEEEEEEEKEEEGDEEETETGNGEVEQVTMIMADGWDLEDDDKKKKKKRHHKEKKERKEKKEKKTKKEKKAKKEKKKSSSSSSSEGSDKEDTVDNKTKSSSQTMEISPAVVPSVAATSQDEEPKFPVENETPAFSPPATTNTPITTGSAPPSNKKRSKFELQMEAALQKKREQHQEPLPSKSDEIPKKASPPTEPEPDWVETTTGPRVNESQPSRDDDEEIIYGAPDDHAWTDQSHAQKEANAEGDDDDDQKFLYGPDGKKLSNKERKKLLKEKAAQDRERAYEKAAAQASQEGAQFACSQTAVSENDVTWQNSLDVNIPSFSISAAGKILFKDSALTIAHGRRYGLVAANGRGKSTLLKMVASRDLKLPPRIDFLYVEQEVVADDTPAVEAVLKADVARWKLIEEEMKLMKALDAGDEDAAKIERLQVVMEELAAMNADAAEAKARRILYGLGFNSYEMQNKPTRMFSGGWRMRISLARALFVEPTLLMLDEPTNHLDLNAVIWLDEYLQKWKKTLLVVSHDQDFLNSVCEEILHIEDLKICSYKGNYDSFKKAEKTKFEQQVKAWEKQEKRLRELKRSGQSKAKAQETVLKKGATKRESGARAQKKKNQDIAAGTDTAETAELIKRPREYQVKLEFVEVAELSRPVIEVNNVHFRYSPKHPVIFDCVDFGIDMDSRVCIVGPNGAGKSTLLKLLTAELEPTKGEIRRNPRLRMGIYNQHFVDRLPMSKTPIEHLRDRFQSEDYQSIRNRLGRYGLEGHAHEVTMRDLSGGQKARVVFVELSLQQPHVLLLDEPTNNLDIETIDALCDAIKLFNGGIVVVTHDQRLIEECECTLWVVEKQGVTRWDAGFEDYKESILRELEDAVEKEAALRREKLQAAAEARAEKLARITQKIKK